MSRPGTRRLFLSALIALVALLLAYGVYWWVIAAELRSAVLGWIEARRAEGMTITYGDLSRSGFPIVARLILGNVAITGVGFDPGWSAATERVVVEVRPIEPDRLTVDLPSPFEIRLVEQGEIRRIAGSAKRFSATVTGNREAPSGTVTVGDLQLAEPDGQALTVASLDATFGEEAGTYGIDLAAADIRVPSRWDLPLGATVTRLRLVGALEGRIPARPWRPALAAWRDSGGTLELPRLELDYGPLRLDGSGTLALDRNGQPVGAFSVRAEGFLETIEALRQRRLVDQRHALAAQLMLSGLAGKPDKDGRRVLSLSLTLQDRIVYAGSVPLLRLPEIGWRLPAPPAR